MIDVVALELGEQLREPLEGVLIPVDPDEVHTLELGAAVAVAPPPRDRLEDRGERGDADPRPDHHGDLGVEDVGARGAVRSVDASEQRRHGSVPGSG